MMTVLVWAYLAVFSTLELRKRLSWAPKASQNHSNVTCFSWLAVDESSFEVLHKQMPSSLSPIKAKLLGRGTYIPSRILESMH